MHTDDDFDSFDQHAVIKVCGIGGGGGNAVNRMIEAGLSDVTFIAINTDAQDLKKSMAPVRLQIGAGDNLGLGAGAKPEVGRKACEENRERVHDVLKGADMVFLTLGLGGGTGTGAAPIVAQEAAESGALTVAIVTLPFSFEGEERMNNALMGLEELEKYVDTLIVVPNDRIAELSHNNTSLLEAFRYGDEVLHNGVRAISELITVPGLINLDFADIRTVMQARGRALMGIGIAEGEDRAMRAAEDAVVCPLLEQSNINGAKSVIVNVRGGTDVRIHEVQQASEYIRSNVSPDATIITGAVIDKEERPEFQVTVIAAGFPKKDVSMYKQRAAQAVPKPAAPPRPTSAAPTMPPPQSQPSKTELKPNAPIPETARPVAAKTPDLFDSTPQSSPASVLTPVLTSIDESDDINIPTFLRDKIRRQGKR